MFHWISDYNYDFAVAAIPIQIILLLFYCFRRNLPIRQSWCFLGVMMSNLTMTIADIVSCEMNEIWQSFPLWVMYLINMVYFLYFILRGWCLADYTAESCMGYHVLGRWSRAAAAIPAAVVCALIISTPWTKTIFAFSADGYYNSILYKSIYYSTYFYIGFSIFCVLLCWDRLTLRIRGSMLAFNFILILGIVLRKLFINTLVTSYFSILTILVIYLFAQNPDLYRDRQLGLYNKDAFDIITSDFLQKHLPFHCIVMDIHNFSAIRAVYDSWQLSACLEMAGRWMHQQFPGYSIFYLRNGQFAMLRRGDFPGNASDMGKRLEERFSHPWKSGGTEISFSINVLLLPQAIIPQSLDVLNDLVSYACRLAYEENQRNIYTFDKEMNHNFSRQKAVEKALSNALRSHSLAVHYQPIFSTKEERVVGAEALARLHDEKIGFIPPDEFIEIAERTGEIMELGRQIFSLVCSFIESENLQDLGIQFINVNLSPAQCMNEQLSTELSEIAESHNVPMSMIDFEITESSIGDYHMILRQMVSLQKKGAELSLDDFGMGTSNLSRLMKLPIHVVKLDMNVVWSFFRGEAGILPFLIRMFQNEKMKVVVEGVETAEMKNRLAQMGCDFEQGYYFSRPIPPEEFLVYLRKQKEEQAQIS